MELIGNKEGEYWKQNNRYRGEDFDCDDEEDLVVAEDESGRRSSR